MILNALVRDDESRSFHQIKTKMLSVFISSQGLDMIEYPENQVERSLNCLPIKWILRNTPADFTSIICLKAINFTFGHFRPFCSSFAVKPDHLTYYYQIYCFS